MSANTTGAFANFGLRWSVWNFCFSIRHAAQIGLENFRKTSLSAFAALKFLESKEKDVDSPQRWQKIESDFCCLAYIVHVGILFRYSLELTLADNAVDTVVSQNWHITVRRNEGF